MKQIPSILALATIAVVSLHAQALDSVRSSATLSLSLGPAHTQINDRILSPVRSDGFVTSGSFAYEIRGEQNQHRIELGGAFGEISNRYDLPAAVGGAHLGYRYLHRLGSDDSSPWSFHAGGSLTGSTAIQFYYLLDESHLYWLTAHELAAVGTATYGTGTSSRFTAELGIPLLTLLSRPPEQRYYNNDKPNLGEVFDLVHQDLHLVSPADYLGFDLELSYSFDTSDRLGETIAYRASYRYSSEPLRGEFLTHALQLSLLYHL